MSVNKILVLIISIFFSENILSQKYISKNGRINFYSSTKLEDIEAVNNKVAAVFDAETKRIVFQLKIKDFVFPIPLMQQHFNENYLESDLYPKSIFSGKVMRIKNGNAEVEGYLTIHGVKKFVKFSGKMLKKEDAIFINSTFFVLLDDYNISVPKIVMYKIAEKIQVDVNIKLNEMK
tara:strand:+ start:58 stop:588 length:531 start_codon:yes stop_codon:yes gene_type:complete